MKILIVGGGEFAENLIRMLSQKEHEIIVIEKDEARKRELESKYDVLVMARSATDVDIYTREVNMDELDAVLALTSSDEINMLVLAVAKLHNIPIRIGRFEEEKIGELVRELKLGIPITQPKVLANIVANYMSSVLLPTPLGKIGHSDLYLLGVAEGDRAAGARISDLEMDEDVGKIILMFDGDRFKVPSGEEVLKPGDILFVLAPSKDFVSYIKG
ncbi:MAG: NAD-binding protein [Thermofilum sp.]|jgi:trk system potassium uptake protein TrkA|nr:NAD-binding protein [Thermofilum sp.]